MLQRLFFLLFLSVSTVYAQDSGWTISNSGSESLGSDVETDAAGNVYVFGSFTGELKLDPSSNVAQLNAPGAELLFTSYIAKYDASGNYLWAKKLSGFEFANDMLALDSQGNVLIAVNFENVLTDLNGTTYHSSNGSKDMGILKLDGDGNQLWIKFTQTNTAERFLSMKVDNQDHILLSGFFTSTLDVDFGAGTELISPEGTVDEFVLKLDQSGDFIWVRTWKGGLDTEKMNIVDLGIDSARNVWVVGYFNTTVDFDPSSGDFTVQNPAHSYQAFVVKLDEAGDFMWAKTFAGTEEVFAAEIAVSEQNDAVIGGSYKGTVQLGSETFQSPVNQNAYLLKMDGNGTTQWARNIQCQGINTINGLEVLSTGVIQFTGVFHDTIYFMSQNIGRQLIPVNSSDTYCAWYTGSGAVKWATRFEGSGSVIVLDLTKGPGDTVAMTGYYDGIFDFNLGSSVETEMSPNSQHAFVKKMYFDPSIFLGLDEKDELHLSYANPVNDQLVYLSDVSIEKASIFSLDGSLVREVTDPAEIIDFRGIYPGVYLVQFKSGKGMLTARIVHL